MRVELVDWNGQPYTITSRDPELIGRWFAEWAPRLMSANTRMQTRIQIWPTDEDEFKALGAPAVHTYMLNQDSLLALAQMILDAAARLGELETAAASD